MTLHSFPDWEALYKNEGVEHLPWYSPSLDPDLEAALTRHGIRSGRVLDQGTGPGTQAIALAKRGFDVTATDVSLAAIAYASRKAEAERVQPAFVQDDILATRLTGPFDVVFDRGCFHILSADQRPAYVQAMQRLLGAAGWLFLKTFSHLQPGDIGPYRFSPDQIRALFSEATGFEVRETLDTVFQGQLDPFPRALFSAIRRR